jgi:hypothetical protein
MNYRNFRIAWSAAWAVVVALLVVFLAASYFRSDTLNIRLPGLRTIQIGSTIGRLQIIDFRTPSPSATPSPREWTDAEIEAALEKDRTYTTLQRRLENYQQLDAPHSALYIVEQMERRRVEFPEIFREKMKPRAPLLSVAELCDVAPPSLVARSSNPLGFSFRRNASGVACELPYWMLVILASAVGFMPWMRWSKRFSLRTLLVATAIVAVVLGLIVWASP